MNTNPYRSPTAQIEERRPIKVKAYGLVPLTRRAYLILQVVMFVAAVAMLFAARPIVAQPGHPFGFLNSYFITIIIVIFAIEGIETVIMLMKFKKAKRERTSQIRET